MHWRYPNFTLQQQEDWQAYQQQQTQQQQQQQAQLQCQQQFQQHQDLFQQKEQQTLLQLQQQMHQQDLATQNPAHQVSSLEAGPSIGSEKGHTSYQCRQHSQHATELTSSGDPENPMEESPTGDPTPGGGGKENDLQREDCTGVQATRHRTDL